MQKNMSVECGCTMTHSTKGPIEANMLTQSPSQSHRVEFYEGSQTCIGV
ncbi:hypothetical protein FOQG_03188 [Fusarium oxysporum f. sp. raphani 54005]|uniref:Uncharacterized protein n=7 Tax=Fusarium oxysporum TaxID=5507 RepID=X0CYP5_FUSOX|nr:hypothetical protein FOXG_17971 [Fusarium oxysporum f. sp. lycopersici 4287]EWZ51617.1 hypothetical protein FOZG_01641 [Fusarium oxysporum Fo47]EWZ90907.1 hypothetical protein FOWG_06692 [Fusarium oxysporum f. sp. lycopersici MN25]EXA52121.1 hypothetical protein FOVG_00541 [Fusarium oxysporum f. sp. pisi HDV247]EXK48918.1 hypothetical protein FOMG_01652 [Fusarium oxysporum f. sp. melonis 26406]EXK95984.1 hypothetical protein FOQG_03188 [Fusarium oxysporum f. sp. raphani 54005]EXL43655.1 hy